MTRLDTATLERVRRRDPAALELFFQTYVDRVYTYVRNVLRGDENVDDLVQSSFLAMHGSIDRLDPHRDPSGWVFTIVTNVLRDWWRSREYRQRGHQVNLDELWNQPPAEAESIEDLLVRAEEATQVQAALGRLAPADRQIIWLRTYEALGVPEVAEILAIRPEAVRQRHSRAVQRLAREFHETQLTPPMRDDSHG